MSSRAGPRLGPPAPAPSADVPPDPRLRRLWLVRAELAFDQSGGLRPSMLNWSLALSVSAGLTLLFGAFFATADMDVPSRTAVAPVLAWLIVATVISGERASRNRRRHVGLCRMQRELELPTMPRPGRFQLGRRCGSVTRHRATALIAR
ncbi:MAG TPA: hypothetical protein VJ757_04965 [Pseudonocardiaceae bacterium]|nr:hypothetical protein [Pseudonocardiaceae bacterium]